METLTRNHVTALLLLIGDGESVDSALEMLWDADEEAALEIISDFSQSKAVEAEARLLAIEEKVDAEAT